MVAVSAGLEESPAARYQLAAPVYYVAAQALDHVAAEATARIGRPQDKWRPRDFARMSAPMCVVIGACWVRQPIGKHEGIAFPWPEADEPTTDELRAYGRDVAMELHGAGVDLVALMDLFVEATRLCSASASIESKARARADFSPAREGSTAGPS